ncbi:hypothetical protein [Rufibacter tibetensis]|uniref:hypothetical protein n=1 Tax=Rufibacter tibetensis TaxID=512763 RepID=UPI0012F8F16E|nr:hypothetical protein [Rufibacter tibetensis]
MFTLLYGLVLAFLMRHHELWFDETEPWLLALYSDSYSELLYNKGFEGHPNLWYSLLFVITRFTRELWTLQAAQFSFAIGFVYVFLRYAPFHWFIRLLFCFGYYGLFEYGVISRLYALELFTTFLLCTLYPTRFRNWYWYIFLLGVNAQTHLFGLFFSGVLGLLLFAEATGLFKTTSDVLKPSTRDVAIGFAVWALCCAFSFWSITYYLKIGTPFIDPYMIQQAGTRVWQAFIPIPEFTFHFWNTSLLRTAFEIPLSMLGWYCLVILFSAEAAFNLPPSPVLCSILLFWFQIRILPPAPRSLFHLHLSPHLD